MTAAESNLRGERRIGAKRVKGRTKWFSASPSMYLSCSTVLISTYLITEMYINNTTIGDQLAKHQ